MSNHTSSILLDSSSSGDAASSEDVSASLEERLDRFIPEPSLSVQIEDKWLLSSALQKLIRRGQRARAVAVALQLYQADPRYLPRRLPIIAVEDIGLGDLSVCRDVMAVCSSSRWWQRDSRATIAFVVDAMASAVKSRAACDLLCWAEVHSESPPLLGVLLEHGRPGLVAIACDRDRSRLERSNALRVLGGITRRTGANYESLCKCDLPGLDLVAVQLRLPPLARAVIAQHRKSGNMASMLPLAIEAALDRNVVAGGDFPKSLELVEGIPLCAVDMFSEVGRAALRDYFVNSKAVRAFAGHHIRKANPIRLLSMALFHAESGMLDRHLTSPALDGIRDAVEQEEMRHLGMTDVAARTELRAILTDEAGVLAATRRHHVELHLQRRDHTTRCF